MAIKDCNRCARPINRQPWHLTAEGMREFYVSAGEGTPEISHDHLSRFASLAIPRATEQGARDYGLHGFLERELDEREPEEELLDVANYLYMRVLKDRWEVEQGLRDPGHADERERYLQNLTAEAIRFNEKIRSFFANY